MGIQKARVEKEMQGNGELPRREQAGEEVCVCVCVCVCEVCVVCVQTCSSCSDAAVTLQ
jgi:hypothetical protein